MSTISSFFSLDPDALRRPHEAFAELRKEGNVVWIDEIQAYAVMSYAEVMAVLRNPSHFSSRGNNGSLAVERFNALAKEVASSSPELGSIVASCPILSVEPVLLTADPPIHTRHRSLVGRTFTPSRVAALEDEIRALAHHLIDNFIERGSCEFVGEFAAPLPLIVISNAFGLPNEDLGDLRRWTDAAVLGVGNKDLGAADVGTMLKSTVELLSYLQAKAKERGECPTGDLIDRFVRASSSDGESFTDRELVNVLAQFFIAGNETTTKMLTSGMLLLLQNPELLERIDAERELIPGFIEEVLRLHPPLLAMFRQTTNDVELGGVQIPADSDVWVMYAAANRDPAEFADPDDIVLDRPNSRSHLAFSQGPHYCLGAALSRLEGRVCFEVLLDRVSGTALAAHSLDYLPSYMMHGLNTLNLKFDRRPNDVNRRAAGLQEGVLARLAPQID